MGSDFAMSSNPLSYASPLLNLLNQSPPEDEPYFAALGRFITSYATAEAGVHMHARTLSRLTDEKARIIFSGMRLGDLSERVRGLMRVTKSSPKTYTETDTCLTQLDIIARQRNKLVHNLVSYKNQVIFTTNAVTAKSLQSAESNLFTLVDLSNMNADCVAISFRLSHIRTPKKLRKATEKDLLLWAQKPWRYKPALPNIQKKRPQKAPGLQKPRPDASQE